MKNKTLLAGQFAGVTDPTMMGTTGLVAWVLHGTPGTSRNRWDRFSIARRIIRGRNLSVSLFVDAILSTGHRHGVNLRRFYNATRDLPGVMASTLRPEFITW